MDRRDRSGNTPRDRKPSGKDRRPDGRQSGSPSKPASGRPGTTRPTPARPGTAGKDTRTASRAKPVVESEVEVISGRNVVREALKAGRRVKRLYVLEQGLQEVPIREAVNLALERRIPVDEVDRGRLDSLALDHQGVVALVSPYQYASWGELLERLKKSERPSSVVLLDTLHDPQNFGTLLRTADALSVDAVVLPRHRSVHVTPAVVRASAGAVEHLTIPVVSNLSRAIEDLQEMGVWVVGIDMDGDRECWELEMTGPTALVIGGEDHGIGRVVKEKCDFLVRIPMAGHVNSLNAAIAGSMVLYEMSRQRHLMGTK